MKAVNLLPPDLRGVFRRFRSPKGETMVLDDASDPTTATKNARRSAAAVGAADENVGRAGALGVLGVLAFCVVALAAYVLTSNTVKDRQAKLDAVTAQAASATQRAAQLRPYADFEAQAMQRVATVKDLAAARFDWEQSLRDISLAVPADVTLTDLTGTVSAAAGGGGSSARAAIPAPAVELKERPEQALLSSATATTEATGCGAGRPPAFQITMFFERDHVPATVQDVTVAAAAATGQTVKTGATSTTASTPTTPTPTPASTPTG